MPYQATYKPNVKRTTGETHPIFGTKYLRRHKIRDPKYQATDKIKEYTYLVQLYGILIIYI